MLYPSGFFFSPQAPDAPGDSAPELLYESADGYITLWRGRKEGKFRVYKALKEPFRGDPLYESILRKEFDIGYSLSHPLICEFYAFLDHPLLGRCIEMEWIDGAPLAPEQLSRKRTRELMLQLCDILRYLHERQVIHRDIKPANLLVTHNGGNLKLIDFGLSDTDAHYLNKGAAGTLQYVAPEVLAGQGADARSDLYSLGCILWESGHYRRIARRCMAADPSRRYATASEVAAALHRSPARWLLPLAAAALLAGLFLLYRERREESAADRIFTRATELMEEAGGVRAAEEP